jgi:uncharacterized membrane protein YgdD (TMEM256/DUF423 family)
LRNLLDERTLAIWHTAVDYQMWHGLGLALVAILLDRSPESRLLRGSGRCMAAGVLLFSGSLYALCLSGVAKLGMITPFGGMAFLLGWLLLGIHAWRGARSSP